MREAPSYSFRTSLIAESSADRTWRARENAHEAGSPRVRGERRLLLSGFVNVNLRRRRFNQRACPGWWQGERAMVGRWVGGGVRGLKRHLSSSSATQQCGACLLETLDHWRSNCGTKQTFISWINTFPQRNAQKSFALHETLCINPFNSITNTQPLSFVCFVSANSEPLLSLTCWFYSDVPLFLFLASLISFIIGLMDHLFRTECSHQHRWK